MAGVLVFVSHFKRLKSDLLMPAVLVSIPVLFFVIVLLEPGFSVAEARAWGWLSPEVPVSSFPARDAWALFRFGLVDWGMLPSQLMRALGLFVIVTFGSSLDIAAIEAGVGRELDYNRELCTVGFANVLAGAVGGTFTGSYIFSQTLFSLNAGVNHKANGAVVCLGEILLFLLPLQVLGFLPTFYIGGVMLFFGLEICADWLVSSVVLLSRTEYALLWVSFVLIVSLGLEWGVLYSLLGAAVSFTVTYASTDPLAPLAMVRSSILRSVDERLKLGAASSRIIGFSLRGSVFFLQSTRIADEILRAAEARVRQRREEDAKAEAVFVIVDCSRVPNIDATAARSFAMMRTRLERLNARLLFSSLGRSEGVRRLLVNHGALVTDCFPSFDSCLAHVESVILGKQGQQRALPPSLKDNFNRYIMPHTRLSWEDAGVESMSFEQDKKLKTKYFQLMNVTESQWLFRSGEESRSLFIVIAGELEVYRNGDDSATRMVVGANTWLGDLDFILERPRSLSVWVSSSSSLFVLSRGRLRRMEAEDPALAVALWKALAFVTASNTLDAVSLHPEM